VSEAQEGGGAGLEDLRIDPARKARGRRFAGRRRLVLGGLAGLVLAGALFVSGVFRGAAEVTVVRATRLDPSAPTPILTAGGYVVPHRKIELSPKITGRIEWIGVDKGDRVKRGQVLIRLDQRELQAQVDQARAALEQARHRLRELETGSRPQEIEQARAAMQQAEANLLNAERTVRRMRELHAEGGVSQQQVDDARTAYEVALAQLRTAREGFDMAKVGPRQEQIDQARAALRQAQATLALALANLANTEIRAPENGTILERLAELGETVTTGVTATRGAKSAIVSMADLNDLRVELDINQNDLRRLRMGMPAVVALDAYPDRPYQATLVEMAPEANRQKATLQVKVKVHGPDDLIRPEMNARATFQEPPRPGVAARILVPKEALVGGAESPAVFLVRDGKAVRWPIKLGTESGTNLEVLEGLQGGEDVVIRGMGGLADGSPVRVKR
jgi:HlyD family secretion protein